MAGAKAARDRRPCAGIEYEVGGDDGRQPIVPPRFEDPGQPAGFEIEFVVAQRHRVVAHSVHEPEFERPSRQHVEQGAHHKIAGVQHDDRLFVPADLDDGASGQSRRALIVIDGRGCSDIGCGAQQMGVEVVGMDDGQPLLPGREGGRSPRRLSM